MLRPIVDPSRAGLTISGNPSSATSRIGSVPVPTIRKRGVGMPAAIQTSLVRHLSIASADAMTPLPV